MRNPAQEDYYENEVVPTAEYDQEAEPETPSWADVHLMPDPPRIEPWQEISGAPILPRARTQAFEDIIFPPTPPIPEPSEPLPLVFIASPATDELQAGKTYTFLAKYSPNVNPNGLVWEINGNKVGAGSTLQYAFPVGVFSIVLAYNDGEAVDSIILNSVASIGGGVWSGYYWFGGQLFGPITSITGKYFGVNLTSGSQNFSDDPFNEDFIEWRYVADKNGDGSYALSNRTSGDIVFRIT